MDAARPPIRITGILGLGIAYGLLAGTAFSGWDVIRHVPDLPTSDLIIAVALASVPAVLASALLTLTLAALSFAFRFELGRRQWSGILAGAILIALAVALVFFAAPGLRGWKAAAAIVAALPVGLAVAGLFLRLPRLSVRGGPQVICLIGVLAILLAVGTSSSLRGMGSAAFAGAGPMLLAAVATAVGSFFALKAPARSMLVLACAIALTVAAFVALPRYPGGPSAGAPKGSDGRPNVVLIVLDTMRRDYLGCYGQQDGLTPELDALAAESVVYEDAFSTSHWTVPSHASIFTGQYPLTHGCSRAHRLWLPGEALTMAEVLGEQGYDTAALFCNPWLRRSNMLQGFDTRANLLGRYTGLAVHGLAAELGFPAHWVDKGAGEACRAVGEWMARREGSGAPFFLFVNLLEVHAEYVPPRFASEAYLPDGVEWSDAARFARRFPARRLSMVRERDEHAERLVRALYSAETRYQDRRLGELLRTLERWSDLDDTLLIITADHGENINDDGRWDHEFAVNDTLVHVPLIIRYPELFSSGTRVAGLCQSVDLLPTVRRVVEGNGTPETTGGRSLVPAEFTPLEQVFLQMYPLWGDMNNVLKGGFIHRDGMLEHLHAFWQVVRTPDWKYIHSSDGKHQLYDLRADPEEIVDLGDAPEASGLREELLEWWGAQPQYAPGPAGDPSESSGNEDLEDLRALGYVSDQ